MKKIMIFLLVLSAMLVSCGGKSPSAKEICTEVISLCAVPYAKKYEYFAKEYSDLYLKEDLSLILYDCDIYDYCSDFSIAVSKKDLVSELHILVAKNAQKADLLKKRLDYRADALRDRELYLYDSKNAETINAMIYQNGLYVCLWQGITAK